MINIKHHILHFTFCGQKSLDTKHLDYYTLRNKKKVLINQFNRSGRYIRRACQRSFCQANGSHLLIILGDFTCKATK